MAPKIKVKNFLFHRVNPVRDELWDPMDVLKFDQCVRYLSKNYQVLTLEEACSDFKHTSAKPIATISFDDGYRDNLDYAAPILQKYKCPASFYIVTDCIDEGKMVWTQEIKHFFQHTSKLQFRSELQYLPDHLRVKSWKSREHRLDYARKIRDFLLTSDNQFRNWVLKDVREQFDDVSPQNLMMSWDEVRQLSSAGFVIGSHTKSHPVLSTLSKSEDIESELMLSGQRIREMLGEFPESIAYPFGAYNEKVANAARHCGYKLGVTSNQQWYYSDRDNTYAISRTSLYNEPWIKIMSRMNGSLERIKELIKGKPVHPWQSLMLAGNGVSSITDIAGDGLNTLSC